ncbi:MAG: chromosome segregation protein SMC [Nitrospirae bacterium]|nr:MAG: chromosome segregation protein SMC [Nitrospirota bacterium]
MYLHTLLINGFKSFPEAKIQFPRGITAVVGPNGAGKSNIVDAILWVLGEQSAKTLRSERMEDVIFNGTEHRKPIGMAEVSLILGDVAKHELEAVAGIGESLGSSNEIMITRRLYRDGESEYLINKIPVRLKDIRSLLWAARAGAKGHTVIEQGNLEQLLNASPQERREFVEATAGIMKYKKQKAEALRKLASTEQNLLRVRDILAEVRRQLRTLERQAKQAQEYQTLKAEARTLELNLLLHEHRTLRRHQQVIQGELGAAEAEESALLAQETRMLTEQEETKLTLTTLSNQLQTKQEQRREIEHTVGQLLTTLEITRTRAAQYEQEHDQAMAERTRLSQEIQETEQTIQTISEGLESIQRELDTLTHSLEEAEAHAQMLATQRTTASQELERARSAVLDIAVEKTNAENRRRSLEEQRQSLSRRLDRLAAEFQECETRHRHLEFERESYRDQERECAQTLTDLKTQRQDLDRRLTDLHVRIQHVETDLAQSRTTLASAESTLRTLEATIYEEFGYDRMGSVDPQSLRGLSQSIKGALGERLAVPAHLETAIEAVLGDRLKAWIVEHPEDAVRGIDLLKSHHLSHGSFLIVNVARPRYQDPPSWWATLQCDPDVIGRAVDVVQAPEEWASICGALLDHVVLVRSLASAIRIMTDHQWFHGIGPVLVTQDGELLDPRGLIIGGAHDSYTGILARRREISAMQKQVAELSPHLAETQRTRDTLSEQVTALNASRDELDAAIEPLEQRLIDLQHEATAREQALPESTRRLQLLQREQMSEQAELDRLAQELADVERHLETLRAEEARCEEAVHAADRHLRSVDEQAQALTNHITDIRLALGAQQARWNHDHETRARLEHDNAARRDRIANLDQRLEALFLQSRNNQAERSRAEARLEELDQHRHGIEQELKALDAEYQAVSLRSQEQDRQLRELRERVAQMLKARGAIDIRLAEVRTKLQTVEETLTGTYDYTLSPPDLQEMGEDDELHSEDGKTTDSPDRWHEELRTIRRKLERIGAVNLTAIDEHQELEQRYQFLAAQEEDLTKSIHSLQEIIQRLNQTTNRLFTETFHALQERFNEVFTALFAGGRAELLLVDTPEEDASSSTIGLEPGIDIIAQPPGKRLKNLSMLSGGEKTLTVLALLFASFLIKPSPFCILDEVDAPLDETNVARFSQFMRQIADRCQFIVITHNKHTMEVADSLFGVTMEEPGISKLVSVRLAELEQVA